MDDLNSAIESALHSNDRVDREHVRSWIREARDVQALELLYSFTNEAWNRIEPHLERDESCEMICRYFLTCINENSEDEGALNRYGAAGELEAWIDHLASIDGTESVLKNIAKAITELYLRSSEDVQTAIETGFLEHVLEQETFRSLFSYWASDERLKDAWQRALEWGLAHPDYMTKMRAEFRSL